MKSNKVKMIDGDKGLYCVLYVFEEKDYVKRVEAIEVAGCGCIVQTTVENKNNVQTESVFVPGCRINCVMHEGGEIACCSLVKDAR